MSTNKQNLSRSTLESDLPISSDLHIPDLHTISTSPSDAPSPQPASTSAADTLDSIASLSSHITALSSLLAEFYFLHASPDPSRLTTDYPIAQSISEILQDYSSRLHSAVRNAG